MEAWQAAAGVAGLGAAAGGLALRSLLQPLAVCGIPVLRYRLVGRPLQVRRDSEFQLLSVADFDRPATPRAEAAHEALRQQGRFVEPLHTLPMGIDTQALPPVAPLKQGCLILARAHPELGLALQQAIAAQGYWVSCELSPWSVQRWQQALAEAAVVIVLPPAAGSPGLGLRRLAAMALGAALVVAERSSPDPFCRDGQNALVRLLDAAELSSAALQLLADVRLRERLVQAAKATLQRHRSALERQRFLELLHQLPEHWQAACRSHQLEPQR